MRVMVLASGDLWAGAEVMIYQLAIGLSTVSGLDLCVILLNRNTLALKLEKYGIEVKVIDESKHTFFKILADIRKLVTEFSPDIIHSHRYKENLLAWLACVGRSTIKLIATQHGMTEAIAQEQDTKSWLRNNLFFRLLSICFTKTVVVSEDMRHSLQGNYGFSDKNITVIHNGIEISKNIKKQENHQLVIGSAGRLFPVKDYSLLVNIAAMVIKKNDNIDFVLAGDGPLRSELEQKVKQYGIEDRFLFLGHQDYMAEFYQSLDIYVNTSVHEGIPMSVLEAMSYGLPVVAPNVGGFPEIVHNNVQGFLVDERNMGRYVDFLLMLISNKDLRFKMGKVARERVVNHFSRDVMAQKYYNLYQELILN